MITDPLVDAPPWRYVDLPNLGTLEVRDSGPAGGPTDQPVVLLLHGWTASADLNWCRTYGPLAERARIVTWDQRGHGARGLRTGATTRIRDLADDAAVIARALDIDRAVLVGYSMGGAVAQTIWKRHPQLVRGLILGATAARFAVDEQQRKDFSLIGRWVRPSRQLEAAGCGNLAWRAARWFSDRQTGGTPTTGDKAFDKWAWDEVRSGLLSRVLTVGHDLGGFDSTGWLGEIDVPHAVLVCTEDDVVPTVRQNELVETLRSPSVYKMATDHSACVSQPDLFVPTLLSALDQITLTG